jgi:hypothetical protein
VIRRDEAAWPQLFELYAPAIRAFAADHGEIGEEEDVAAKFRIPRNSVSQIKTRVERMISAIESEFQT